jgi:hypothetical protein
VKSTKLCLILLICVAVFPAFAAEEAPAQRLWYVHQEFAKPSMIEQYEASAKAFNALVKENASKMPHFNITGAFQGEDMLYTYSIPIASLSEVDQIVQEFGALVEAAGQRGAEVMQKGGLATEQMKEWIIAEPLQMGYVPAQPRLKPDEMKYFRFDMYYVQPGHEADADAVAADFKKLFTSKGIQDGYRVFKVLIGEDISLYTVQSGAKDAADFAMAEAKHNELLGKEGEALFARAFAICRKVTHTNAWFRPDLTTAKPKGM